MKNLMKTASAQNFHRLAGHGARFIRKFETMENDIPQVDFSRDLQELGENVEQQSNDKIEIKEEDFKKIIDFIEHDGVTVFKSLQYEFIDSKGHRYLMVLMTDNGSDYVSVYSQENHKNSVSFVISKNKITPLGNEKWTDKKEVKRVYKEFLKEIK